MPQSTLSLETYLSDDGTLNGEGWAEALRDGLLLGQRCGECGHTTAAPKGACGYCGNRELEVLRLPTEGEVYTETAIETAPMGLEPGYQIVIVDLGEARVLGHVGPERTVSIGETVRFKEAMEHEGFPAAVFE